jgi:hypothetical protein
MVIQNPYKGRYNKGTSIPSVPVNLAQSEIFATLLLAHLGIRPLVIFYLLYIYYNCILGSYCYNFFTYSYSQNVRQFYSPPTLLPTSETTRHFLTTLP